MVKLIRSDLDFILQQIRVSEAHAAGGDLATLVGDPLLHYGLRTVDGTYNNLLPGQENFGAADQLFPRSLTPSFGTGNVFGNYANSGVVVDDQPRVASNLIVDQSANNPAAVAAALKYAGLAGAEAAAAIVEIEAAVQAGDPVALTAVLTSFGIEQTANGSLVIPNVAPDEGLSAPFNSWFTLFGQFFDHGLDLVAKGGSGSVIVPLLADDPLVTHGPDGIAGNGDEVPAGTPLTPLTRTTNLPGPDGILGDIAATPGINEGADDIHESTNTTTSFVDQNQTYTSHSSHQVFLREYVLNPSGQPVTTGLLLGNRAPNIDGEYFGEGSTDLGGLTTWAVVKAQARELLGINLTDADVGNVPVILTDEYGRFIPDPVTGYAQVVLSANQIGGPLDPDGNGLASGTPDAPISLTGVQRTGHAFLDDIANTAAPRFTAGGGTDGVPRSADDLNPDGNTTIGDHFAQLGDDGLPIGGGSAFYDNELLDAHKVTGDGRGNENIGLTSVHHVFHSEHNRMVEAIKATVIAEFYNLDANGDPIINLDGSFSIKDAAFASEWVVPGADLTNGIQAGDWNGERLFQTAKFSTEMQYQHLVFEEFARKVQPLVNIFAGYQTDIDPSIVAEFAHVVYRFGHSMLTEEVARLDENGVANDVGLIEAFLNPVLFDESGLTDDQSAGAVIRGMTRQQGNEIDEFVTNALRNNLLGLPLDLATINMARARDTGVPTLNEARRQFYEDTGGDSLLKPYTSWVDFAQHVKNPLSVINFIAAYGTHDSITTATTLEAKFEAAKLLVLGGAGAPADRIDFLNSTAAYESGADGATVTGLDDVDFWVGGLAEAITPFGGLLGSTFNFVFETQLESLQNGDRFYYLSRLAGTHFLTELEGNSFASIIMKNTDLGDDGMHLPGDVFSTPTFILEVDQSKQVTGEVTGIGLEGREDPVAEPDPFNPFGNITPLVVRDNPNTVGTDTNYLQYTGVDHVVLGGTNPGNAANPSGNDILIASIGDDTVWGDGGDDIIEGGHGVDQLIGGDGDDIITDLGGDDNIKGGDGDDVVNAGQGLDLILLGDGSDFSVGGEDANETFGGEGNDFIFAGDDSDTVFGDGGDDWIEGGDQADLLQGDFGAPFQDSTEAGNDVIIGGGGNDDYDSESGDDIMVAGVGTERFEGMLGFDWVTYRGSLVGADADFFFTGLLPPDREALRDRFDLTEGLSGSDLNDVLRGDNSTSADLLNVDVFSGFNNAINSQAQVDLISGLDGVLGLGVTTFSGGNIILGGDGSDIIEGRGGDDIIDGDASLNVRIAVIQVDANGDPVLDGNGNEIEIDSANNMGELQARMFSGELDPGQLRIVREILAGNPASGVDIAQFSDIAVNYEIEGAGLAPGVAGADIDGDGYITVSHIVGGVAAADGVDKVRNIEVLQFADGVAILDPNIENTVAEGELQINDLTTPEILQVGDILTVSIGSVTDADNPGGVVALAAISLVWQVEQTPGVGDWIDITDPIEEALITGPTFTPTAAFALDGLSLRVRGTFTGANGVPEVVFSGPTLPLGSVNSAPVAASDTLIGPEDSIFIGAASATDPEGQPLTYALVSNVASGTLNFAVDGNFDYTPDPDFTGLVSFTYSASDGSLTSNIATITINVTPGDDPPVVTGSVTLTASNEDAAVTITADQLRANVTDSDNPLTSVQVLNLVASSGSIVDNLDGTWTFTPAANDDTAVSFTYDVSSDSGVTLVPNTASLDLLPVNDAPVAGPVPLGSVPFGALAGFLIDQAALLGTSSDADGDALTALNLTLANPAAGTLTNNGNGTWTFVSLGSTPGTVAFNFDVTDGAATVSTSTTISTINLPPTTIAAVPSTMTVAENVQGAVLASVTVTDPNLTDVHNFTLSDSRFEIIDNNVAAGQQLVLKLKAGISLDFETASSVNLVVNAFDAAGAAASGNPFSFTINVTNVNETATQILLSNAAVNEDANNASLVGLLSANDPDTGNTLTYTMLNNAGGRFALNGNRIEVVNGVALDFEQNASHTIRVQVSDGIGPAFAQDLVIAVNDVNPENVLGTGAGETIVGGALADIIDGQGGADLLTGGGGGDTMRGGQGDDRFVATVNDGNDSYDGGAGVNTYDLSLTTAATDVNLLAGTATSPQTGSDTLVNIQNLIGSQGNNILVGNNTANTIQGLAGNDTILGSGGVDSLQGGDGIDTLHGGAQGDIINGGAGDDIVNGGAARDTIIVNDGNDTIVIGNNFGNDVVVGFDAVAAGGQDLIDLRALGITTANFAANVQITDVGTDTLVTIAGDGTMRLLDVNGVGTNVITRADFILA